MVLGGSIGKRSRQTEISINIFRMYNKEEHEMPLNLYSLNRQPLVKTAQNNEDYAWN